jgi:hypothetical protein
LVDLLDAQVSLDQARTNVLVREKEQQLAALNLCFQSGIILQELGVDNIPYEEDGQESKIQVISGGR